MAVPRLAIPIACFQLYLNKVAAPSNASLVVHFPQITDHAIQPVWRSHLISPGKEGHGTRHQI